MGFVLCRLIAARRVPSTSICEVIEEGALWRINELSLFEFDPLLFDGNC